MAIGRKAKGKSKSKGKALARETINEAHAIDDLLTRRLPIHELKLPTSDQAGVTLGPHPLGAVIRTLRDGSVALEAGLKLGDVIVSVDGETFETCHEAAALISKHNHRSDGSSIQFVTAPTEEDRDSPPPVRLSDAPIMLTYYKAVDAEALLLKRRKPPKLITIDANATRAHFSAVGHFGTVLVSHPLGARCEEVKSGSLAEYAGLRTGDVLVTIGGWARGDPKDAKKYLDTFCSEAIRNNIGQMLRLTVYPAREAAIELVLLYSSFLVGSSDDVLASVQAMSYRRDSRESPSKVAFFKEEIHEAVGSSVRGSSVRGSLEPDSEAKTTTTGHPSLAGVSSLPPDAGSNPLATPPALRRARSSKDPKSGTSPPAKSRSPVKALKSPQGAGGALGGAVKESTGKTKAAPARDAPAKDSPTGTSPTGLGGGGSGKEEKVNPGAAAGEPAAGGFSLEALNDAEQRDVESLEEIRRMAEVS